MTPTPTPTPTPEPSPEPSETAAAENSIVVTIGDAALDATLADNSSADALHARLEDGPLTVQMSEYGGMEKVGSLGFDLPTNDQRITTAPGDLILYQGGALVLYYAPNTWSFTRLGSLDGIGAEDLIDLLGPGDVELTLSLG